MDTKKIIGEILAKDISHGKIALVLKISKKEYLRRLEKNDFTYQQKLRLITLMDNVNRLGINALSCKYAPRGVECFDMRENCADCGFNPEVDERRKKERRGKEGIRFR